MTSNMPGHYCLMTINNMKNQSHHISTSPPSQTLYWSPKIKLWPPSTSELYRPSDRRLSAKLVTTFADIGCDGSLRPYSRISIPEPLLFLSSNSSIVTHEAEWTPFQTHYFSENPVASGIEPGPLDLQPGTLTTRPQGRAIVPRLQQ
jgi:hypothetical protein